jgi:glycosyltransferase involved in cell wall biosynthesis
VEEYLSDPVLSRSANLVIVGGDLEAPDANEREELSRIDAILRRYPSIRGQVVLLGHRPNDAVAQVLAAARYGWGADIAGGGAYVCGSRKEEFGLAIVEAMAAGLPVVAPGSGGPASYVDPGVTGVLVDSGVVGEIAAGIRAALELATDPMTARRASAIVEDRFTIGRMARTLTAVYRIASGISTLSGDVRRSAAA